jgi:hypothetical protein
MRVDRTTLAEPMEIASIDKLRRRVAAPSP